MDNKPKDVFLIGGTGRTGTHLINKLLANNCKVTAMTRNPAAEPKITHPDLKWVGSDILDPGSYSEHLVDKDAVVSALGMKKGSPADLYSKGYTGLLTEMEKRGVSRLVAVTADGNHPNHNWFFRYVVRALFIKKPLRDMEKFEAYLRDEYRGPVEYTIVRPFRLLEGEIGSFRLGGYKEIVKPEWKWQSHTGDVAKFCVDVLRENLHINEMMSIGQ